MRGSATWSFFVLTGAPRPPRSGKSHILSTLLKANELGVGGGRRRIEVTATTGVAACNVGGVTIHRYVCISFSAMSFNLA